MIRNLKALGLALVAVFAMSAMVAAAAQAAPGTLTTAGGLPVTATGEQIGIHEFTLTDHPVNPSGFAKVECTTAHFFGVGTEPQGDTQVTVKPTYHGCTAFGQPATVNVTNCHYLLRTQTKTGAGTGWHVLTDLTCPNAGEEIHVDTGTCSVTVPPQNNLATSEVTNAGAVTTDLLLHTNITGITYTVTKDNIGCPLTTVAPLPKTFHNGDYKGTTTVKGLNASGEQVSISLH